MRARALPLAVLVAVTLVAGPSTGALADGSAGSGSERAAAAKAKVSKGKLTKAERKALKVAKAKKEARQIEAKAANKRFFVLGGRLVSVTPAATTPVVDPAQTLAAPADVALGTLTFVVHGGRYKALRGTQVTVSVAPDAKITRDGAVPLAELLPGDHVVVKSRDYDVTGTKHAELLVAATVSRVAASPAEDDAGTAE